jgi:hypothetical protein
MLLENLKEDGAGVHDLILISKTEAFSSIIEHGETRNCKWFTDARHISQRVLWREIRGEDGCRLESVESSRHCHRPLSQRSTNEFIPQPRTVGASTAAKYSTNSLGEYRRRSGDVFLGLGAALDI